MSKKLSVLVVVLAMLLLSGLSASTVRANGNNTSDDEDHKVKICHRSNAVNNPWQVNEVDDSSVNASGHSGHSGPIPTSEAEAQALKDAKIDWGDIIPPTTGFPSGLNWNTSGAQAIYNNNCEFVETQPTPADISYTIACSADNTAIEVTFTNSGQTDGIVDINGKGVNVPAGGSVVESTELTKDIEITINDETVIEEPPVCAFEPGRGGGTVTPTSPAAAQTASLPQTSGPSGVAVFSAISGLVAVLGASARALVTKFL